MAEIVASTYEILESIGSGGGGVVYLGKHIRLNKTVVLKADKRKLTTAPELLRREVDALKDLSHQYIPQVYDFFTENDIVYTVIDYVPGESFDKPLKRGQRFTQPQVIEWAIQMLEALAYLHKPIHGNPPRGIVHSDIKPANIMLTPQNDIRLIDFNIALALGEENIVGLSAGYASPEHYGLDFSSNSYASNMRGGIFSGKSIVIPDEAKTADINASDATIAMDAATEVLDENEKVVMSMNPNSVSGGKKRIIVPDARSDIYSLGATLYHLLSGVRPAKRAIDVVPLSKKDFSPRIVDIISKSMAPDPALRYQSAEEMLYDFTHLRENDPRTKKQKKALFIAGVSFTALLSASLFTAFTGLKRMQAEQQALTFAEYSQNALEQGNVDEAVKYALEALPVNKTVFTPDYSEEARKALADAVGVYDLSDGFKPHHIVQLPSETFKIALSPDGKNGVSVYSSELAVFDVESGEIKKKLPITESVLSEAVFADNNTLLFSGKDGLSLYEINTDKTLWTGKPATNIAVSADKTAAAGIFRDENIAYVYNIDGSLRREISLGSNKQYVVEKDIYADYQNSLLAMSGDGKYMAASFENGGVTLFDTLGENDRVLIDRSDFTHFEGGFYGKFFAFSGTKQGCSEFFTYNTETGELLLDIELENRIGVLTNAEGVYISNLSTIVKIDPVTGEQTEVAYTDSDIRQFCCSGGDTIAATEKNEYLFYDGFANLISRFDNSGPSCDFVAVAGDYALAAGRDTDMVKILKRKLYDDKNICSYDGDYYHDEARINETENRLLLFSYKGFRIYDMSGKMLAEKELPDADKVYDQQYSRKSGNLAVMYNNAFRLYSGTDGSLVYEAEGLNKVMYTNYGVSICDGNEVKLIDLDSGAETEVEQYSGDKGVWCGNVITNDKIGDGEIIGAGKTGKGYFYAVANDDICSIYNENGTKTFEVPVLENSEIFFTENYIITVPAKGSSVVYDAENGKKKAELDGEAAITYITEFNDCVISEYVTSRLTHYGYILDKEKFKPVAELPCLTDISDRNLYFDYHSGVIRGTRIYTTQELISIAKENIKDK